MYKYEAKSVKGVIFMISTLFSIIIMGLSITGYIDLSLTEHQFRDVIQKEVNGELTCIGSNKTNVKNLKHDEISRKSRHVLFDSPKIILEMNCSHAAEVLSTCYASIENSKREDLGTGKSFSEALILVSTNPQYEKRLFIELLIRACVRNLDLRVQSVL